MDAEQAVTNSFFLPLRGGDVGAAGLVVVAAFQQALVSVHKLLVRQGDGVPEKERERMSIKIRR